MQNKKALVTGSSSGIGYAIAVALAEQGIEVMMHGLEPVDEGSQLAQALQERTGTNCHYCSANLADSAQLQYMVQNSIEVMGQLDILVNNAGIQYTAPVTDFPAAKWDAIIAINLSAAFHASQAVLPGMIERGWGRIINIASVHGLVASVEKSAYCAAKHGLVGLTKVMALENADKGVTANCICPGWTDTPLLNHQIETFAEKQGVAVDQAKADFVKTKAPYPEMVAPAEIGALAIYLCSDAAKAMTGVSLPIDGGWTAH